MNNLDVALFDGSVRLHVPIHRGSATFSTGEHGAESLTIQTPLARWQAFDLQNRLAGILRAQVSLGGVPVWEGRTEDIQLQNGGATVQAFGRWRTLRDQPITTFYSLTELTRFRAVEAGEVPGSTTIDARFQLSTQSGQLVITPQKNSTQGNAAGAGDAIYVLELPDDSLRGATGVEFDFEITAPDVTWRAAFQIRNADLSGIANVWGPVASVVGTLRGSVNITFASAPVVSFFFDRNAANVAIPQETGDIYLKITNFRLVSATGNRVNTTTTAITAPGSPVTIPVVSSARMYVGQRLQINTSGAASESVVVTAVPTATSVTVATLVNGYAAGVTVRAHVVYADEIAQTFRDYVNTINAGALSTSNALIQSPGLDLLSAVYEDADMGDVLTELAGLGNSAGTRYEVGVAGSRLYLRPRGSTAQAWAIDASDPEVQATLDQLVNAYYARYQAANNRTLRTPVQSDAVSIARFGIQRRRSVDARTSNAEVATRIALTAVSDTSTPVPRASLTIRRLYTASGALSNGALVRAGDTITIRNLPPVTGVVLQSLRTFTVFETDYDLGSSVLSVVPETPLPLLEYLIARNARFGEAIQPL